MKKSLPAWAYLLLFIAVLVILGGLIYIGASALRSGRPTPAPTPVLVDVTGFEVIHGDSFRESVSPRATIRAGSGETVEVTAEVAGKYQDLTFTWYTCRTKETPVLQRIGDPSMVYVVPMQPGHDCIVLDLEILGRLLDRPHLFVSVEP